MGLDHVRINLAFPLKRKGTKMNKDFVTLKYGKVVIQCKPGDISGIMSSLEGKSEAKKEKVYEKSAVVKKAVRSIKASSPQEFVLKALANREGLHTVFSGLNDELRTRFEVDPKDITNGMIADGLIAGRLARKGFWISNIIQS